MALLAAVPARADDALARVRQRGVLRIATDATYPPFESIENDTVVGFDREIGEAIGEELKVRVEFVSMEWSGVFAAVETGKCDLVMSGVTITEARKKGNAFTRPYFLSGQVLARRKGDTRVTRIDDLKAAGRTAAVQQETTGQFALEKVGISKDRIHRFDTLQDALLDTRNRNSDAVVGDLPALADMIRKGYPEMEIVPGGPFVAENLGIVARRDARDLVAAINDALARIFVDGRYARAIERWMHEPLTPATVARLDTVQNVGTAIPPEIQRQVRGPAAAAPAADSPRSGSALTLRPEILRAALPALLRGALLTVELTVTSLLLGVPLGLLLALGRMSSLPLVRAPAIVYIEAVRGTPLLMQISMLYFLLPALGLSLSPFAAGLAALSLNSGAYIAEIFRAGIESIDTGQREAARALGLTGSQTMRHVILPQTLRRVLPPLTNEAIALLKDSSLVSVVSLSELMRVGKEIATTAGAPTTIYLAVALLYLGLTLPLTALARRLERRWQPSRRRLRTTQ